MRNLFMLLLLINVLAFAYQRWVIAPDNPVAATHIAQDYPRLSRAEPGVPASRAAGPSPAAPSRNADATVKDDKNAVKCMKIGPISREKDGNALVEALRERGITARTSAEEGKIWVGHWVQVVGLSDRAAAEATRERLVAAGLTDAYIVTGGDEVKISLGVYRSLPSAEQTIARARALGVATRMEERFQPGVQYWLTVTLPDGRRLRPGELRSDTGQILRTEAVPCK